jgi:predicted Zn-dependent peptidase
MPKAGKMISGKMLNTRRFVPIALIALLAIFAGSALGQTIGDPREERLLNGLKLLMFDAPASDKVTVKIRIHAGSAFDPQGKEGTMRLLAASIFPTPEAREYFSEQLGGGVQVETNYDYIQINASSTPENLVTMLDTIAAAIVGIDIDKETTPRLRAEALKSLEGRENDAVYAADNAAAARFFGSFPYGRPLMGTTSTLAKIDFADLLAAKERFLTADNATIVIAGRFDKDLAYKAVRRYFGSWIKSDKRVPSTFKQPDAPQAGVQEIKFPAADRFETRYITRGTVRSSSDTFAYRIAAIVLENRLRSAISGATISVRSVEHILPGTFSVAVSGNSTISDLGGIVAKAFSTPVSDSEFAAAKQAVVAALSNDDLYDQWLDVDTFKSDIPSKFKLRASAIAIGAVQNVFSRLKGQPFAIVAVSGEPKTGN